MRTIKFRAWDKENKKWLDLKELAINPDDGTLLKATSDNLTYADVSNYELSQFTGLTDKNGVEIYEGDIVGDEGIYHFLERGGWKPASGLWKIIGEKSKNFTGKGEEKYVAAYKLNVVEWKDKSCGFEPFSDSEDNCGHCGGGINPTRTEVIGNVFENPELLNH